MILVVFGMPYFTKSQQAIGEDSNAFCGDWANTGQCDSNPEFMSETCPKNCLALARVRVKEFESQLAVAQARASVDESATGALKACAQLEAEHAKSIIELRVQLEEQHAKDLKEAKASTDGKGAERSLMQEAHAAQLEQARERESVLAKRVEVAEARASAAETQSATVGGSVSDKSFQEADKREGVLKERLDAAIKMAAEAEAKLANVPKAVPAPDCSNEQAHTASYVKKLEECSQSAALSARDAAAKATSLAESHAATVKTKLEEQFTKRLQDLKWLAASSAACPA